MRKKFYCTVVPFDPVIKLGRLEWSVKIVGLVFCFIDGGLKFSRTGSGRLPFRVTSSLNFGMPSRQISWLCSRRRLRRNCPDSLLFVQRIRHEKSNYQSGQQTDTSE